jgi:hypothetical protein
MTIITIIDMDVINFMIIDTEIYVHTLFTIFNYIFNFQHVIEL